MMENIFFILEVMKHIPTRNVGSFDQVREENDHSAATPCIIVFYFFILFNCSHIVATTEYFESTRRYCYPKCALAFLGFKSTKK